MIAAVHAFAETQGPAADLAARLDLPLRLVSRHGFPDGERLVTVFPEGGEVIAYCSLDHPTTKLMDLLLACDGWRRSGVTRLVLVAPYLCYMRQDAQFAAGQAVSRDVIGRLLGDRFDRILTVDPHLHRTQDLGQVFAPAQLDIVSAAVRLAEPLRRGPPPIVVGPDFEAAPWAQAVADALGAPMATLEKVRRGDREVVLSAPPGLAVAGRRVILVDDICASGVTLEDAAVLAASLGAIQIEAAVVHALHDEETAARLVFAGVQRVISTTSCPHPTNAVGIDDVLAAALRNEVLR